MEKIKRFGISVDKDLIEEFDEHIKKKGYKNRSEAIRDLIRDNLVSDSWELGEVEVIGTLTIVYDHHKRDLTKVLNEIQHKFHSNIVSVTHVHMDEHNCLEVLIMKGIGEKIKTIADRLIGTKGVKHGKLVATKKEF